MELLSIVKYEFQQKAGFIHLNHAAVGPWPKRTAAEIKRFADENVRQGSLDYAKWVQTEADLRKQFKTLLNARSVNDIGLLKNTSEGLSVVAYGLPWQAGDNIVISDQEFPSNRIVWESLQDQGVEVRVAKLDEYDTPEEALFSATDSNTRLLAISSVQYASGLRVDLRQLGAFCKQKDIWFCVDAIQSIGAVNLDVTEIHADFVVADGHKWMLGPEGIAVFYTTPEARDRLQLKQYGWHMVQDMGNYTTNEWQIAESSRRFECGSPNMLGIHGLHASLSLLLEIGMDKIEEAVLKNSAWLIDQIKQNPDLELLSSDEPGRYAGIVTFRSRTKRNEALHQQLMDNSVLCALRGGGIRLSPHFYNQNEQLEKVIEIIS